ncbi:MYG1 exonuclease, partial [Geodia barretti]
ATSVRLHRGTRRLSWCTRTRASSPGSWCSLNFELLGKLCRRAVDCPLESMLAAIFPSQCSRAKQLLAVLKPRLLQMSTIKKHCAEKTIGTHDGTFHCDEVLACYMLKKLPEFSDARIVRTRNESILETCDVVVDVGGVYDSSKHRYDHHQRSFTGTMSSLSEGKKRRATKLSSAGLVYLHFGHRVLSKISDIATETPVLEDLYDYVYAEFMEEIDAVDNGISDRDGEPRYSVNSTIGKRVARLNPDWNETASGEDSMV